MSSFYSTIFVKGLSGSTGPTGSTGSLGPVGPIGPNVYGSTGSSIIGITLDSIKQLLFTFEDGSTASSSAIVSGATGSRQARISGQGTNTIFSSSVQGSTGDFIVLKNFKTNTPESIGITLSDDQNSIVINYINTLGGTFSQSELNRLVIGSGTGISSANITNYDTLTKSLDIKIDRYLEGITNVYPENILGDSTSQWDLNTDLYSIFNLQPETTINTYKIININSTVNDNISRGITVIIPSGITASGRYIEFIVNDGVDVLFPMDLPIRLTDKLEVVNMISMGKDKWYGSFALWNNDSSININTKTPVFDLIAQNGTFWSGGSWLAAKISSEANSCSIYQSNSNNVYERPCIVGGSSSGGGAGSCINPTGPATGSTRLLRGGAWDFSLSGCRASQRAGLTPDFIADSVGFRVAKTAVPAGWYTMLEQAPDPTVVTNTTMRNAIIASGLPWRVRDNSSNIEMLLVPAGTFTMGCSPSTQYACAYDESPTHQVTLTNAFYMGKTEVTQAQWTAKMGSNPSFFSGYTNSPSFPVERVSWDMVASGSTSFMDKTGLRLPTEAEWEYAYRAGTTTAFHRYTGQPNGFNDDTLVDQIAWYNNGSNANPQAVAQKAPNGLGLHDMAGNVYEWCQDWYGLYSNCSGSSSTSSSTSGGGAGNPCLPFYVPGAALNFLQGIIRPDVDPTVVTNPKMRAAITATGLPWMVNDSHTGMDMVLIPGGTFIMGSVPSNPASSIGPGELPQHEVAITLPFYMSIHEVTQITWRGVGPAFRENNSVNQQYGAYPVENLTKEEILQFLSDENVHLPTEAEWEYACRGGYDNENTYSASLNDISWNKANSVNETHVVMQKQANPLGLYDMLGNVFEYTYKCPPYTPSKVTDPVECPLALNSWIGRGGGYLSDTTGSLNASNKAFAQFRSATNSYGQYGFRVIRRIKPS